MKKAVKTLGVLCLSASAVMAQQMQGAADLRATTGVSPSVPANSAAVPPVVPAAAGPKLPEHATSYELGPEDQIVIHAFRMEEISDRPIQIGGDGYINLPFVGRVKAAGLTVSQFEQELVVRLKNYVLDPQVTVMVADYRSQPVSVVGAVNTPGVVQLKGRKNLVEVIALAGGLKPDAGNTVTITREISNGKIPLPNAAPDPTGKFSIAHVNLNRIMQAKDPQNNILVDPNDVIMIPKAQLLYVVGEVQRPGGYVLDERDSISVLQAVALAGGLTHSAAPRKAKILHEAPDRSMKDEPNTDVYKILNGKAPDVQLSANDVLFIPNNLPKSAGGVALQTAMNMAGVAIWRF